MNKLDQLANEIRRQPRMQQAVKYLRRQTKKLGLYLALLEILSDDIDLRRQIEKIELGDNLANMPPERRDSVRVERTREQMQAATREAAYQIAFVVDLLIQIVLELSDEQH